MDSRHLPAGCSERWGRGPWASRRGAARWDRVGSAGHLSLSTSLVPVGNMAAERKEVGYRSEPNTGDIRVPVPSPMAVQA